MQASIADSPILSPNEVRIDDATSLIELQKTVKLWMHNELREFLSADLPPSDNLGRNEYLYSLMASYPLRPAKYARPLLMILMASLWGIDTRLLRPSLLALELFQNFALVHDDIEDGSNLRRGQPALHIAHGVPLAINAGDALFNYAFKALLQNSKLIDAELTIKLQERFGEAFQKTLEGQAIDIGWRNRGIIPSPADYLAMVELKTAWYSGRIPCEIGALIAQRPADELELAGELGRLIGIGFQIRDDILSLSAPEDGVEHLKDVFGDIAEGKRSLIIITLFERIDHQQGQKLRSILDLPPQETTAEHCQWVLDLIKQHQAFDVAQSKCRHTYEQALRLLDQLPSKKGLPLLAELIELLLCQRNG